MLSLATNLALMPLWLKASLFGKGDYMSTMTKKECINLEIALEHDERTKYGTNQSSVQANRVTPQLLSRGMSVFCSQGGCVGKGNTPFSSCFGMQSNNNKL